MIVKLRFEPKDFRCYTEITGKNSGKKVLRSGGTPRVLYRWKEAREELRKGGIVFIVDGEKDVERAFAEGGIATCGHGGCGKWEDWMTEQFQVASPEALIYLFADNDANGAGNRGARKVYRSLCEDGVEIDGILRAKSGKDLYDHFEAGHEWDELVEVNPEELAEERGTADSITPELSSFVDALTDRLGTVPDRINPRDIAKAVVASSSDLAYTPKTRTWYRWNGMCYEGYDIPMRTELLATTVEVSRRSLRDCVAGLTEENKGLRAVLLRREYTFSGAQFPRDLEAILRDMCQVDDELFDTDSSILACESGVLDREAAKDGRIAWLPHDSSRRITRCIPIKYDPDARCPEWDAFLASSTRSADRLRVMLGFALAGDNTHKKRVVNLVGPTDTGKSTALDLIDSVIGCYLGTMRAAEITISRHNAKFDFHGLRGSRAVFCAEPEQNSRFRIADLKRLTGGEMIVTEGKGQAPVSWRASVMPFIGTNYHIHFDTTDEAFERRNEFIEFERTRKIDHQLKKRLMTERVGIFNWILQGVLDYFEGRLADTPESLAARSRAEAAVEGPLQFIDWAIEEGHIVARTDLPAYKYFSVGTLYGRYRKWCDDEGIKQVYGRQHFSTVVEKRYTKTDKASGGGKIRFIGLAPRS
jgi:putative DNA primase/helicase